MANKKKQPRKVPRPKLGGRVVPRLRDWEVLKLREQGLTYEEISQEMTRRKMPMCANTARDIVNKSLVNMAINLNETGEAVRQLEVNRLEGMLAIATKLAKSRGKAFNRLAAMDRVSKIVGQLAKLKGLEVDKHEHKHTGGVRIYEGVDEYEKGEKEREESNN